jgi:hypothetical protein
LVLNLEFCAAFPAAVVGFGVFWFWRFGACIWRFDVCVRRFGVCVRRFGVWAPVGYNVLSETVGAPDFEVDGIAEFAGEFDKRGV